MAKYIMFKINKNDAGTPIIFEDFLTHVDIRNALKSKYSEIEVVSAGFIKIDNKGQIIPYGESISLGVKSSIEVDTLILNHKLNNN